MNTWHSEKNEKFAKNVTVLQNNVGQKTGKIHEVGNRKSTLSDARCGKIFRNVS